MYKLGIKKIVNNKSDNKNPLEFKTSRGLVVIGVDPKYHGKGVGSLLLQEFERLAKLDGVQKITLSVKPENLKAIKSYTKNGWLPADKNVDSLSMYKEI
jgi:GNAT superfamily N-acetyltransferase